MCLALAEAPRLRELHVVQAVSDQTASSARPRLSAFFLFSVFDLLLVLLLMAVLDLFRLVFYPLCVVREAW